MTRYRVAVTDVRRQESVARAVGEAIDLAGGFQPGEEAVIAIKPNLTTDKNPPESGVTTHLQVVEGVIEYINRQVNRCQILIVESDSDGTIERAFTRMGYRDLTHKYGNVQLVNLSSEKMVKLVLPPPARIRSIEIPEVLFSITHYVAVANLKRHVHERMTGIWKGNWGLPSNHLVRMHYHPFLSEALFDLNSVFWPDLSLIDGIIGLEGAGPFEGYPKYMGRIICSHDPLAADIVAAQLMGERPNRVPALKYALKRLPRRAEDIELCGDPLEPVPFKFIPEIAFFLYRLGLWLRKLGIYLDNLGCLCGIVGFGLRIGQFTDYVGGGVQSLSASLRIARDFLLRPDVGEQTYG